MSNLAKREVDATGLERVLLSGDLGSLSPEQRVSYYTRVCESVGLNPLTQPFEYLKLNGRTVLYAKRACTDQLRKVHRVSVTISSRERVEDIYIVTARAETPDGRCDESIGAVPLGNLKGEALSNALMKAETKAKRRVTLAICGLSMLDELEVASVQQTPRAKPLRTLDDVASEPAYDAETGEVCEDGRTGDCPSFTSGEFSGRRYDEVPTEYMKALLQNQAFLRKAGSSRIAWARHVVAQGEEEKKGEVAE